MKEILKRLEQKIDAGFAKADRRFDGIEARLDKVDERLDKGDTRFAGIEQLLQKQGVLLESVSADVKMALEGISGNRQVLDQEFAEVLAKLDERVQPIEMATRYLVTNQTKPR